MSKFNITFRPYVHVEVETALDVNEVEHTAEPKLTGIDWHDSFVNTIAADEPFDIIDEFGDSNPSDITKLVCQWMDRQVKDPVSFDEFDHMTIRASFAESTRTMAEQRQRIDELERKLRHAEQLRDMHNDGLNSCGAELQAAKNRIEELEGVAATHAEALGATSNQYAKLLILVRDFISPMLHSAELDPDHAVIKSLISMGMEPFTRTVTAIIDYGAIEVKYDIDDVPNGVDDEDIEEALRSVAYDKWDRIVRGENLDITVNDEQYEAECQDVDMNRRCIRITID